MSPAAGRRGSRAGRHGRPQHAAGPLGLAVVALFGWGSIAHNSGSGWVQALGAVIGGILVVGLLGPALALARVKVTCTQVETDGTAGRPSALHLRATGRVRVRPLDPAGSEGFVGPTAANWHHGPEDGLVVLRPERRGVFDAVTVELATAAPFGLLWWARTATLALPATLHVAPAPGPARPAPPDPGTDAGSSARRVPAVVGEPRGVRPYRAGDSRRAVHWPATAHARTLMVREMEAPAAEPVTVDVALPGDPEAAEALAGQALGTVTALLGRGVPVVLGTVEAEGRVVGPVTDHHGARRRLARAVDGSGDGSLALARGTAR